MSAQKQMMILYINIASQACFCTLEGFMLTWPSDLALLTHADCFCRRFNRYHELGQYAMGEFPKTVYRQHAVTSACTEWTPYDP